MTSIVPDWSQVTALFGGTFDPPHRGHVLAAQGLLKRPGVKQVWVIPSGTPVWKDSPVFSAERRLKLCELAFAGDARIQVNDAELSGPRYTVETLEHLRRRYPDETFAWVMGSDQLAELHRWKGFPQLLGACHWIVLGRKPMGSQQGRFLLQQWESRKLCMPVGTDHWLLSGHPTVMTLVDTPAPAISSSQVRDFIEKSRWDALQNALAPGVLAELKH